MTTSTSTTRQQAQLLAADLQSLGYIATVTLRNQVIASLSNRSVSTMEIDNAIEQLFDCSMFSLTRLAGRVIITI